MRQLTVGELILELRKFPPKWRVSVAAEGAGKARYVERGNGYEEEPDEVLIVGDEEPER